MVKSKNRFSHLAVFIQTVFAGSLLAIASSAIAGSQHDAMDWIQKMSNAMQELSYKGKFVYLHDGQLESMSILHVNDEQGKRERLVSLNGEAREILRDNNTLTCVWPSSKQVVVDQSNQNNVSPIWIPEDVDRLSKFYKFNMMGDDRIADHDAVIISIQPKDQFRYGMKIWLDKHNGLLLQSAVINEQGKSVEQVMFTELSLLQRDEQKLFSALPKIDDSYALIRSHDYDGADKFPADNNWRLQSIPNGFWQESSFRKKMANSQDYIQHMIFTDGMASISVFIERENGQQLTGESSMGAVNAFGSVYQDYTVTAIGEVPAVTVREMASSVIYLN